MVSIQLKADRIVGKALIATLCSVVSTIGAFPRVRHQWYERPFGRETTTFRVLEAFVFIELDRSDTVASVVAEKDIHGRDRSLSGYGKIEILVLEELLLLIVDLAAPLVLGPRVGGARGARAAQLFNQGTSSCPLQTAVGAVEMVEGQMVRNVWV